MIISGLQSSHIIIDSCLQGSHTMIISCLQGSHTMIVSCLQSSHTMIVSYPVIEVVILRFGNSLSSETVHFLIARKSQKQAKYI